MSLSRFDVSFARMVRLFDVEVQHPRGVFGEGGQRDSRLK